MNLKLILGVFLGIGILLSITTDIYADNTKHHKSPLRQMRDDGVLPQDVKCNQGKVLFFKIANVSPVCIYEDSIGKLNRNLIGWLGSKFVDYDYIQEKNSTPFSRKLLFEIYDDEQTGNRINVKRIIDVSNHDNRTIVLPYVVDDPYRIKLNDNSSNDVVDYDDSRYHILNYNPWTTRSESYFGYKCKTDLDTIHMMPQGTSVVFPLKNNFSGTEIFINDDWDHTLHEINDELHYVFSDFYETEISASDGLVIKNVTKQTCLFESPDFVYDRLFTYEIFLEYED